MHKGIAVHAAQTVAGLMLKEDLNKEQFYLFDTIHMYIYLYVYTHMFLLTQGRCVSHLKEHSIMVIAF